MKLFTKSIDEQLFKQYPLGANLENQQVVAKIFNPYGAGVWYLLNSDPEDPDYLWAIVDLFEVEMGSASRSELESLKVPPFNLGLERDLYFEPINAKELYNNLLKGQKYQDGGMMANEGKVNKIKYETKIKSQSDDGKYYNKEIYANGILIAEMSAVKEHYSIPANLNYTNAIRTRHDFKIKQQGGLIIVTRVL